MRDGVYEASGEDEENVEGWSHLRYIRGKTYTRKKIGIKIVLKTNTTKQKLQEIVNN